MRTPDAIAEDVLNLMAGKFRMLSDPARLVILNTLVVGGESSVGQIVDRTGRNLANVTRHRKQLTRWDLYGSFRYLAMR